MSTIKNLTLPNGWKFNLDRVPAFPGTVNARITDSNSLLGGFIDPRYIYSDLFLVAKKSVYVKRFYGFRGQRDIFVQISENEVVDWLRENGYLETDEPFDLSAILNKAVIIEFKPRVLKIMPPDYKKEEPSRFLEGLGTSAAISPWPANFNEW